MKGEILFDEPMTKHTSLLVGGPAEVFIIPKNATDVKTVVRFAKKRRIPLTIIGNGTKLLVSDCGIPGITVKISGGLDKVKVSGDRIAAGAGYPLAGLSRLAAERGLSGLEFAIGIPGTVGAGVVMNAGAHGSSLSDIVTDVVAMNFKGEILKIRKEELGFGFRHSALQTALAIVLVVKMKLKKADQASIEETLHRNIQWRKGNQPSMPNAGSIFKSSKDLVAGKLIDGAGLKGMKIGGARISEKRSNFIVNEGGAKSKDILRLIRTMQQVVYETYGIRLELEIRLVGDMQGDNERCN